MHHIVKFSTSIYVGLIGSLLLGFSTWGESEVDLSEAVIVTRDNSVPCAEHTAATVLAEEIEKRTSLSLPVTARWPEKKTVIALVSGDGRGTGWAQAVPARRGNALPEQQPEGYRLLVDPQTPPVIWVIGADVRGTLYGVGALLRTLNWAPGRASVSRTLDTASAPRYPLRGHQLGYRALANSYDAWSPEQYDQYIRELALFGVNSIENIPFQDKRISPVMQVARRDMNQRISEICARYDLDYWVFAPADFDLRDTALTDEMLGKLGALFEDCPRMNAVFFPGGDPGDNPPELVLPYLEAVAALLLPLHPEARIWLSLLGFSETQVDFVYAYIDSNAPPWFGGLVADTSGPPIPETRRRLPAPYRFRLYPDITHNKLCQFEVFWWDPAYALTLGREAINPRPVEFASIINWFAPWSDGFITYSDGIHDDVNKVVWTRRGWNPDADVRELLIEYARFFFGPDVAEDAADGILALEKNWQGPLATNGAVDGTLMLWQRLEAQAPHLADNWRWQMNLLRAYYDAYTRCRLNYETRLEKEANALLASAPLRGAEVVMRESLDVLHRADTQRPRPEWLARIEELCEALFLSIGLQTSVERYHAVDGERGAVLDYVTYPLNNRWWLEDEFAKVSALESEQARQDRLERLATWETPGPGSFYDDIGHIGKSPRVRRSGDPNTDPEKRSFPSPTFWWWGDGMDPRARLSWQWTMDWPEALHYNGLDPEAAYTVRMSGQGQLRVRFNGVAAPQPVTGIKTGELVEIPIPAEAIREGSLVLTWDAPENEAHLNWRQHSRLAEVWLLKND